MTHHVWYRRYFGKPAHADSRPGGEWYRSRGPTDSVRARSKSLKKNVIAWRTESGLRSRLVCNFMPQHGSRVAAARVGRSAARDVTDSYILQRSLSLFIIRVIIVALIFEVVQTFNEPPKIRLREFPARGETKW